MRIYFRIGILLGVFFFRLADTDWRRMVCEWSRNCWTKN